MKGPLAQATAKTGLVLGIRVATQAASLLLLTRLIDAEMYGRLIAASSFAMVLGILPSLGAGYVMMVMAPKRTDAVAYVWGYAWPLTIALGLLLLSLYLPGARILGGEYALPLKLLLVIGLTELLIIPFTALFSFALQARGYVPLSQVVQWLPFGFRALAILPCFASPIAERPYTFVALQFTASVVGLLISVIISKKFITLDWHPRLASKQELKSGAHYAAMHMVAANTSDLDKMLAIRFISPYDAGIYAATNRVTSAFVMPVAALLLSAQSRIFRHAQQPTTAGAHLIMLLGVLAAIWGGLSWTLLYFASPLLPWLLGSTFTAAVQLMPLVAAAALPYSMRLTAGTVLVALGKPSSRICFELGGLSTLFCGMAILAPQYGVEGVAIALIICEYCMALGGWLLIYRHM